MTQYVLTNGRFPHQTEAWRTIIKYIVVRRKKTALSPFYISCLRKSHITQAGSSGRGQVPILHFYLIFFKRSSWDKCCQRTVASTARSATNMPSLTRFLECVKFKLTCFLVKLPKFSAFDHILFHSSSSHNSCLTHAVRCLPEFRHGTYSAGQRLHQRRG